MNCKTKRKNWLIFVLCFCVAFLLVWGSFPETTEAVSETGRDSYSLAKGVTESTVYVTESKMENVRVHILRINKGSNISIKVGTKKYYKKNSTKKTRKQNLKKWVKKNWGLVDVSKIANSFSKIKDKSGRVIAAVNGDYYLKEKYNGATEGNLIMEGNKVRITNSKPFFAVLKTGKIVIRDKKGKTSDVKEAVGGHLMLVKGGKIVIGKNTYHPGSPRHPNTGIGVTKEGAVVVMVIDGEEPTSLGASWHELGIVMKQQGCVDAIMLDGGGSSSFLTKRKKGSLKYRNTLMEGEPRNVSSAILFVENKKGSSNVSGKKEVSMKSKKTCLKKNSKGIYSYKINGKAKKTGFVNVNGKSFLFDKKGKGITTQVTIGKNVYFYDRGMLKKSSDAKSGKIAVGYCGADKDGKNLIYAYHYGDNILNIGVNDIESRENGSMANWKNIPNIPWEPIKYEIKSVIVGKGIKTIGKNAFQFPTDPFNDNLKKKKADLSKAELPDSLTKIADGAFVNAFNLKNVTVPENVTDIGKKAFAYNSGMTIVFKSAKPPKFGKAVFLQDENENKNNVLQVPDTKDWRSYFGKISNLEKIKFTGRIKYVK